jgi:hypothetical protein
MPTDQTTNSDLAYADTLWKSHDAPPEARWLNL